MAPPLEGLSLNVTLQESDKGHHSMQRSNHVPEDSFYCLAIKMMEEKENYIMSRAALVYFFPLYIRFIFEMSNKHLKGVCFCVMIL